MIYKTSLSSFRDSHVALGDITSTDWAAAEIVHIFDLQKLLNDEGNAIYVVVRKFPELSEIDVPKDYYRTFPHGGKIFYQDLLEELCLAHIDDVACHFAKTSNVFDSMSHPHIHALPLDKVSSEFYIERIHSLISHCSEVENK